MLLDKALLRRTWYIKYLEREYPQFYEHVQSSVEYYLIELYKFEYDRPYMPAVIQTRFLRMLQSFFDARMDRGVFLSTPWTDQDLNQIYPQYTRVPYGLAFKLAGDTLFSLYDFDQFTLTQPPVTNDARVEFNLANIRSMLEHNVVYLNAAGRSVEAAKARQILDRFK